jgi:hypothetical protein
MGRHLRVRGVRAGSLGRPDGTARSIHRVVGNNGSFGGNALVETIGLADATTVARLTVTWPTSRTTQVFRDLDADRAITIVEGSAFGSNESCAC